MKVLAERGYGSALVALEEPTGDPFDQTLGVVVNTRRGTVSEPAFVQSILARGYWIPFTGDEEPVLALVSSAVTAAAFDESKHPRHPKGSEKGGEFAPKSGQTWKRIEDGYESGGWKILDNGPGLGGAKGSGRWAVMRDGKWAANIDTLAEAKQYAEQEASSDSWLKPEATDAEGAYYKATKPREAVALARSWLEENGVESYQGIPTNLLNGVGVVGAMQEHFPDGYEFFLSVNDLHKEDFRRHYMRGSEYVPERAALHNGIRAQYLSTAHAPPAGEAPTALFLAGGSGAGKSSILGKQGADGEFTGGTITAPSGAVYVNPDDIKELLPESESMKAAGDTRWAALSHEESSDIAQRLRKDAEQAGLPMVVDGTGDSAPGKFLSKVKDAEAAGYKTKVVFVDTPTDEAIKRARGRALRTGRKVADAQIREIHQGVSARHLEWRDQVADWEVWANDDPSQGGRRLIARRVGGGPIEVLDRTRYAQLEAKGR